MYRLHKPISVIDDISVLVENEKQQRYCVSRPP